MPSTNSLVELISKLDWLLGRKKTCPTMRPSVPLLILLVVSWSATTMARLNIYLDQQEVRRLLGTYIYIYFEFSFPVCGCSEKLFLNGILRGSWIHVMSIGNWIITSSGLLGNPITTQWPVLKEGYRLSATRPRGGNLSDRDEWIIRYWNGGGIRALIMNQEDKQQGYLSSLNW